MFLLQLFESGAEVRADGIGIHAQLFFFDDFDGGEGGHAGYRIAAEGGDGEAAVGAGEFGGGDGGADGHAVAHAFGAGNDVRDDLPMLDAEPVLAGAGEAGLHFIGDEEPAVFLDGVEDDFEVFGGRSDEAADALDRFGDEGGDVAAGAGLNEIFDLVGAGHAAIGILQSQRAAITIGANRVGHADADYPGGAPRALSRDGLGERGGAGIAVAQSDDVERAGGHAGQQEGGFVGLGAGIGEEGFLQTAGSDLR